MKTITFASAFLGSTLILAPAFAQTADQHDEHRPTSNATAPAAASGQRAAPGMMNMMGGGMDMSAMMRMMSRMHAGMGDCMSDPALDHVEGRLAFLRTELHITDAQNAVWTSFAEALRAQAQKSAAGTGTMMDQGGLPNRIDRQERGLAAKLDGVRTLKAAFTPLYAALSDEQKKAADVLLGAYFGMPMMGGGAMQGGMMQGGRQPGAAMPMSGKSR